MDFPKQLLFLRLTNFIIYLLTFKAFKIAVFMKVILWNMQRHGCIMHQITHLENI